MSSASTLSYPAPAPRPLYTPISETAFKALTPAEQRVAIAHDILTRIDKRLMGGYAGGTLGSHTRDRISSAPDNAGVRDAINDGNHTCYACAKGAVFLSWVGILDSVSPEQVGAARACCVEETMPPDMVKVFGMRLLSALEVAYEGCDPGRCCVYLTSEEIGALEYAFRYSDSGVATTRRLRILMENLVDNGGKLVIEGHRF